MNDSMALSSSPIQVVEHRGHIELNIHELECATTAKPDAPRPDTPKPLSSPTTTNLTNLVMAVDKTLSITANLTQLLPTGTVLAFGSLSSPFTNNGICTVSNKYLTALLIYFCLVSCIILTFTNSLVGQDGKLYYGLVTFKNFYIFNYTGSNDEAARTFGDLQRLRIRFVNFVHAFCTAVVFLFVAFSDTGIKNCFFSCADHDILHYAHH